MVIFNSYVSLPEGKPLELETKLPGLVNVYRCLHFANLKPWPSRNSGFTHSTSWIFHFAFCTFTRGLGPDIPQGSPPAGRNSLYTRIDRQSERWPCSIAKWSEAISGWWFRTLILCFHILGIMIPTDFHIFQRGRYTTMLFLLTNDYTAYCY